MTFQKQAHRCRAVIIAAANDGGCQVSVCTCGKWRRWVSRPHRFGAEGKWRDAPAPFCRGPLAKVEVVRP